MDYNTRLVNDTTARLELKAPTLLPLKYIGHGSESGHQSESRHLTDMGPTLLVSITRQPNDRLPNIFWDRPTVTAIV